jgi:hypothetical protein
LLIRHVDVLLIGPWLVGWSSYFHFAFVFSPYKLVGCGLM